MSDVEQRARAIILHDRDNAATALTHLSKGTVFASPERNCRVVLDEDIPFGHKFPLVNLDKGERVIKYGVPIGQLTQPVKAGAHVHLHNLVTLQRKAEVL